MKSEYEDFFNRTGIIITESFVNNTPGRMSDALNTGPTPESALEAAKKQELFNRSFDASGNKLTEPKPQSDHLQFTITDRGDSVHPNRRYYGGWHIGRPIIDHISKDFETGEHLFGAHSS